MRNTFSLRGVTMSKIAAILSIISTISIASGQDFHGGWEDSFIPGIRPYRAREPRTPRPLTFADSPIFFPGADDEDPATRHREGLPDDPLLPSETDTTSDGVLDLPSDFNEIDVSVLNRINTITNISDLAALFDLELPQSSPSLDLGFDIAGRIGETVKEEGESFEMANCKPELVTVPLDLPAKASTMYFPTCIRIEQCGGCCYGPLLTCRPTVTKIVKVKVLQITTSKSLNTGRGGGGGRRRTRRQSHQSYRLVEVARHTTCECGCRVREEDCNSDLHVYYEGECACKCKNKDEQTKCEQQNTTKYWDNNSCNCFCRKTVDCGSGEIFSQATCSCERLGARHGLLLGEEEIAVPVPNRRRRKPMRVPIA